MKKRLFDFIIGHRLLVLFVLIAITAFFGWHAVRISINTDIEEFYLEDDVKAYNRFLDEFGTDHVIAIAFETEDPFSVESLRVVDSISAKMEMLPNVSRAYSLTTAKLVYGEEDMVHFDRLMEEVPSSEQEMTLIKQRALDDPFASGILMSSEQKDSAIIVEVDHIVGESYKEEIKLAKTIKGILKEEEERTGKRFLLGGNIIVEEALSRYTQTDNMRMFFLSAFFMLVITYLMFRQIVMTILPMLVVLLTSIWTHGFMTLMGFEINTINIIIRALLMAVATAGSMHIIADYLQKGAAGIHTKVEYLGETFRAVAAPCFLAAVTTAIGLLSLLTSDIIPLRKFGLTGAVGVMFSFVISIFLLPILLSIIPVPKGRYRERIEEGLLAKILIWLGGWQKKRAIIIILVSSVALIPAILSLPLNIVGTNSIRYLRKNDDIRKQIEWLDDNIGGTRSLEFLIDGGRENAFKDPSLLRKVERFQDHLKGIKDITEVYSAVDLVKTLNRAFHGGKEEARAIPETYAEVTQQLFIIEGSRELEQFMSYDYSKARVMAMVKADGGLGVYKQLPEVEKVMHEIFGDTARISITGQLYSHQQMEQYIVTSQIKSFALAFVVIQIIMILILRSFRLGMLAMVPNFLPILFGAALLPLLGYHLDIGTTMPAIVTLGLVVDDSIHFLTRLRQQLDRKAGIKVAIARSMNDVGRPIIFTSLVLGLGFLAIFPSKFVPGAQFGILAASVVVFALVFDLLVLPAIMGFVWSGKKSEAPSDLPSYSDAREDFDEIS